MPTGYTAAIAKGLTFQNFVLNCARAFGVLIELRDELPGAEIPVFTVPVYYHENLAKAIAERDEIAAMTPAACLKAQKSQRSKRIASLKESISSSDALRHEYEKMLSKVSAWQAPSSEHQGLKDFMVQQITDSIRFDCGTSYLFELLEDLKKQPLATGATIKAKLLSDAETVVAQRIKDLSEESIRITGRNKWISQLKESLQLIPCGEEN